MIRAASEADLPALRPLMRGYCDFYGADPPDAGLDEMVRALIAEPDDQGILLVATDEGGEVVGFAACRLEVVEPAGGADRRPRGPLRGRAGARPRPRQPADRGRRRRRSAPRGPLVSWQTLPDNHRAQAVYDRVGGESETLIEYKLELKT